VPARRNGEPEPSGDCEGYEIGTDEARAIPAKFVGALLGSDEVTELQQILVTNAPKKPPASSVRVMPPSAKAHSAIAASAEFAGEAKNWSDACDGCLRRLQARGLVRGRHSRIGTRLLGRQAPR
jgi:hypothetical protein